MQVQGSLVSKMTPFTQPDQHQVLERSQGCGVHGVVGQTSRCGREAVAKTVTADDFVIACMERPAAHSSRKRAAIEEEEEFPERPLDPDDPSDARPPAVVLHATIYDLHHRFVFREEGAVVVGQRGKVDRDTQWLVWEPVVGCGRGMPFGAGSLLTMVLRNVRPEPRHTTGPFEDWLADDLKSGKYDLSERPTESIRLVVPRGSPADLMGALYNEWGWSNSNGNEYRAHNQIRPLFQELQGGEEQQWVRVTGRPAYFSRTGKTKLWVYAAHRASLEEAEYCALFAGVLEASVVKKPSVI